MTKTLEEYWSDWESQVFGYGYGTGEEHTIPALKTFFAAFGRDEFPNGYDYRKLEAAVGPLPAWLLINTLCHADLIEYGTSPRVGWLTDQGVALKQFVDNKTTEELIDATERDEGYAACFPNYCNCVGKEGENLCGNPFFPS